MPVTPTVMWFRRDLRLADHPALCAAAAEGPVVPLFVLDPALLGGAGAVRTAFLSDSLAALDAALDGGLVVRRGAPAEVVPAVAEEVGARTVHVTRDFGPAGRARDAAVAERLRAADRRLVGTGTPYAVAPGGVTKGDGGPYAVFTPFFRAWQQIDPGAPLDPPVDVEWVRAPSDGRLDRVDPGADLPPAGEGPAHDAWTSFASDGLHAYDERRDLPAVAGTSRLSPYLKWGQLHPRQLLASLDLTDDAQRTFASELAWRDFYADVLHRRPETAWANLDARMDAMPVDTDAAARRRFDRWCGGTTGFPIVDAGMRQLAATGWMHNRVRMITASFLVKDLHLPWQWGARHFMAHLVDGDLASNNHGWQWAAGTGTDAAPYFRVFNPTAQQERFDPDGEYVARWIPELGTADYPDPMVDHAAERAEALARYKSVTGR